jgi:YYY domain-containing protein
MSVASDLLTLIWWWFSLLCIGVLFFPFTRKCFPSFFDEGYLFSKTIGLAIVAYLVWLCSSVRLAPFEPATIIIILFAVPLVLYGFPGNRCKNIKLPEGKKLKIFIAEESLFLLGLFVWSYLRGIQPDIRGLEKFMDYGFVNACLRARFMPPEDLWFAGSSINYYYFGHYITALLTRLTHIQPAVTYNLMIATLFSFTLMLSASLAANAVYCSGRYRKGCVLAGGIISALLVSAGGSLHTALYAYVLPALQKINLYRGNIKPYWYPDATRYIGYNPPVDNKTIHEFPFYSFIVSDLHAHVLDIPFVLTFLALLFSLIVRTRRNTVSGCSESMGKNIFRMNIPVAFFLALFSMTSTWDVFMYFTVAAALYLAINFSGSSTIGIIFLKTLKDILLTCFFLMLFALPFFIQFRPFSHGIGLVQTGTPLYQLGVLWGYQVLFVFIYLTLLLYAWKCFSISCSNQGIMARLKLFLKQISPSDIFVSIIAFSALALIMAPEILYVKDIYPPAYCRSNTMFKCTYQAFILLGLASGFILVKTYNHLRQNTRHFRILTAVLAGIAALPLLYPYHAIKGYYGSLFPSSYKGLDGMSYLKKSYPDDYEAVSWLTIKAQDPLVILEANGDSYTDYGRISMATGLPTILGWFTHEWLWRGNSDIIKERAREVSAVYESDDIGATDKILQKYNVAYIIIGQLEKQKFKLIKEDKLLHLGTVAFHKNSIKIISVDKKHYFR